MNVAEANALAAARIDVAYAYARRHTNYAALDPDDVLSACMLGLMQASRLYDPSRSGNFVVFARLVMRCRLLDAAKREWAERNHTRSKRLRRNEVAAAPTDCLCEQTDELLVAMQSLSEREQAALRGLFFEHLTMQQVASRLGLSAKASVHYLLHRAIRRCRRERCAA